MHTFGIMVNHNEFKELDFPRLKSIMKCPVVFDTRNYLDADTIEEAGMEYHLLVGEEQKKVLMVAYQFPPVGSGVQRRSSSQSICPLWMGTGCTHPTTGKRSEG